MQTSLRHAIAFLLLALTLAPLAASAAPAGVVNVNTATLQQLELLPRIGPAVAQRILDRRKASGNHFASLDDLMLVQGIGEKTFALLKPYVALAGETTLREKVKSPRPSGAASATAKSTRPAAPPKAAPAAGKG